MFIPLTNVSAAMVLECYLRDQGFIDGADWQGGFGIMPADHTNYILVRDSGARKLARIARTGSLVKKYAVQIRTRCMTYEGYTKLANIENGLSLGLRQSTLTVLDARGQSFQVLVSSFEVVTPATFLGANVNDRSLDFSLNGFLNAKEIV